MSPAALILCVAWAAIPPLTDAQSTRLGTAADGRDDPDDAFAALVEHVARWTPGAGDAALRSEADLDLILAEPSAYRGELYRVAGSIQQQAPLPYPYEDVSEWVVRDGAGRPILVYVCGLAPDHGFRVGRPVVIPGRFYKRVDAVALDGRLRRYPAFVGAFPRPGAGREGWARLWTVTIPVAVMLTVFLLLLLYARRGRGPMRARAAGAGPWTEQGSESLPEDPAEALAELRRRAEADG
ncbi:MAG: hypothetical protein ACYTE6_02440 [Planctomycetota bacterium]|jgi:hypothetical protein